MAIASLYPTIKPSLLLDFANSKKLDPRVTFTCSTTATYYDGVTTAKAEQNLLRESQNLVSSAWAWNGGYAGTLGAELVVNGDFASGASWVLPAQWTITGGEAVCTNGNTNDIYQFLDTFSGTQYYVSADVVRTAGAGTLNARFGGGSGAIDGPLVGTGRLAGKMVGVGSLFFQFRPLSFTGTLDNASLKIPTSDNVTAPDGTATAVTATADAANATFTQSVTAIAAEYTFSVYLRRVTGTGDIDIQCGGGTWVTQTITSSWARYTVTQTLTAGTRTPGIRIVTSGDQIEVWGAQLEQRSAATAYTPTTTQPITNYVPQLLTAPAGVPRFDHNPTTGESLGLLVEEQRTNLLTYSEDFSNAAWVAASVTVTQNSTVAPDGTTTADTITHASATGELAQTNSTGAITVTCSFYAKYSNVQWIRPVCGQNNNLAAVWFDIQNGIVGGTLVSGTTTVVGTPTITSVGNGWYRCSMTVALGGTGNNFVQLNTADANNSNTRAIGSFFVWGAQLEAGAFPTSYIRTTSATVTRTADAPSMTGANFSVWNNAAEGAIYTETIFASLSSASGVVLNDGTTSNRIRLAPATVSDQATVTTSGTAQAVLDAGTPVAGAVTRLAMAYAVNDFALSLNGGAVATDTSGTVPVVNQFQIGAETTAYGNVRINKIAYYPERLTNAQLQALTA